MKAAFATEAGQIHDEIVETQFGYHIIKVTDRKAARTIPFAEAKDGVKATLLNQKRSAAVKATGTGRHRLGSAPARYPFGGRLSAPGSTG